MNTNSNNAFESNTYSDHDMMNGGVTINLMKLAIENGHVPTSEEAATIAAHDAMPRNTWYTHQDVAELIEATKECARELSTVWARLGQVNDNKHAVNARAAINSLIEADGKAHPDQKRKSKK